MSDLSPVDNYQNDAELDKRTVENFIAHLDGVELEKLNGGKVRLAIRKGKFPVSDPKVRNSWTIVFKGYPEDQNYIWLEVNYVSKEIEPCWAQLSHPDLKSTTKGQGVFPQIRRLIGRHFPEGFTYKVVEHNIRTKAQFLDVRERLKKGNITSEQAREEVFKNYKIQERTASGFNKIEVRYKSDQMVCIYSSRIPEQKEVDFNVVFDL